MCWYIYIYIIFVFDALIFTLFTPVYKCFAFSSLHPLHNCIQVCYSLKPIQKITTCCIVEKTLFLCFFYPERLSIHFFHRKESMRVSFHILYISYIILIFWSFLISLHCFCRVHLILTLGERKMLSGLICSRRNRDVIKQRRQLQFSEFVGPKTFYRVKL